MTILFELMLVLHLIGWAIVLGGALTQLREPRLVPGMLHGILTALVTGIIMVGLVSSGSVDEDANDVKFAVKLVIAVIVAALVIAGTRKPERVSRGFLGTIAALVVVNVSIAVLWT